MYVDRGGRRLRGHASSSPPATPRTTRCSDIAPLITYGASPRASLGLVAAGRALALLRGRSYVLPQDVFDVAPDVLRHRLVLSYEALAQGVSADQILVRVLSTVPAPHVSPAGTTRPVARRLPDAGRDAPASAGRDTPVSAG